MKSLLKLKAELVGNLRKQSAGYGFVMDESIKLFEEQFVIPALTFYGKAVVERTMKIIEKVVLVDSVGKFNSTPEVGEKFDLEKHNHANRLLNQMNQYIYQSLKSQLDK